MRLTEHIEAALKEAGVALSEFRAVLQRLLSQQVILRDPGNRAESEAYDLFVRVAELAEEYLAVLGFELMHSREWSYVIVYPPGANYELRGADPEDSPAFMARPSKEETALLLVCRKLFEERLREGRLGDESEVLASLEEIYTQYHYLTKEPMPEQLTRRAQLFQRMKQLRVLQYRDLDVADEDSVLVIRPTVLALTFQGYVEALTEALAEDEELVEGSTEGEAS